MFWETISSKGNLFSATQGVPVLQTVTWRTNTTVLSQPFTALQNVLNGEVTHSGKSKNNTEQHTQKYKMSQDFHSGSVSHIHPQQHVRKRARWVPHILTEEASGMVKRCGQMLCLRTSIREVSVIFILNDSSGNMPVGSLISWQKKQAVWSNAVAKCYVSGLPLGKCQSYSSSTTRQETCPLVSSYLDRRSKRYGQMLWPNASEIRHRKIKSPQSGI